MSHQVNVDDLKGFKYESILASSSKDDKRIMVRTTIAGVSFAVQKEGLVQVFTNLAAAVKRYNG